MKNWMNVREKLGGQINEGAGRKKMASILGMTPKKLTRLLLGVKKPSPAETEKMTMLAKL